MFQSYLLNIDNVHFEQMVDQIYPTVSVQTLSLILLTIFLKFVKKHLNNWPFLSVLESFLQSKETA